MDNLPDELIMIILEHLNLKDLIRLRKVSKRWRILIDQIRIKEMVFNINGSNLRKLMTNWYNSTDQIKNGNMIELDYLSSAKYRSIQLQLLMPMFLDLKCIKIIFIQRLYKDQYESSQQFFNFILNKLHTFSNLDQLELEIIDEIVIDDYWFFTHPTLRVLYVNRLEDKVNHFVIDMPKLQVLFWGGYFGNVIIKQPQSILKLEGDFKYNYENPLDLSIFTNLKSFHFFGYPSNLSDDFLSKSNLDEFHYDQTLHMIDCVFDDLGAFVKLIREMFEQKEQLKKDRFKFFWVNKQLDEQQFKDEIWRFGCESLFKKLSNN